MDAIDSSAWQRVPLAEAVLTLFRFAVAKEELENLFQRLRGRCYTKILDFHLLVQLMHDALLVYRGSGRQSFEHAKEDGSLSVSIQAAFGKLRRVPIPLSEGFLAECTDRRRQVFPKTALKEVPEVLPEVRRRFAGPRLWVADRQFADLVQTTYFTRENDHFLVRYNKKLHFHEDSSCASQKGRDASERKYVEDWGWIGGPKDKRRRRVRRVTLSRPGEEDVVLLTDLLDGQQYPAVDLLALYAERWSIERMFQQVTEVFHLETLIGGSPEATVFQFAFCLVLYNMIQVVRASIAAIERCDPNTISTEKLFLDVERELTACTVLWDAEQWAARVDQPWRANEVKPRLRELLRHVWTDRWIKAKSYRRQPHPVVPRLGVHVSVHRILLEAKEKRAVHRRQ